MISNLTLHEVKTFFKGVIIVDLKDERFYVQRKKGNIYQLQDLNMNALGFIEGK